MISTINKNYTIPIQSQQQKHIPFKGNVATKLADSVTWGIKKIETGGLIVDVLFVDALGMIFPRVWQAFNRNKEELGHLNYKSGVEEFIREITSGPSMFLIPMAFIALSKKIFGRSSNIQFKIFDAFTDSFKNVLNDKNISGDKKTLKENFYRKVFNEAFEPHKHNKNTPENTKLIHDQIEKIVKNLSTIETAKNSKANIIEIKQIVSDLNKSHGINLDYSHQLTLKSGIKKEVGTLTTDLVNYSKDVVENIANKIQKGAKTKELPNLLNKISKFKTNGRRTIIVSTVIATSAFLYSVPLLYKRNKQFPGINGLVKEDKPKNKANITSKKETLLASGKNNETFKGEKKDKHNISFTGNLLDKGFKKFDFNGHSAPHAILAFYTLGLMLGCRLYQARDANERREVATRDFSGLLTIIFALPVFRNVTAFLSKKTTGFPVSKTLTSIKSYFNPSNKPYSFENISDVYSGVSKYQHNLVDFSQNISNEGGNLRKIFNFLSDDSKKALNKLSKNLSTKSKKVESGKVFKFITKPFRAGDSELKLPATNPEIIQLFKDAQENDKNKALLQKVINELDNKENNLVKFAETLKSVPEAISIVAISGFLGWFLPWFNINYTRKLYKSQETNSNSNNLTAKKQ